MQAFVVMNHLFELWSVEGISRHFLLAPSRFQICTLPLIFPIPFSVLLLVSLALKFRFTFENEVNVLCTQRFVLYFFYNLTPVFLCRKNMSFCSWKKELKPWRLLLITRMKVFRVASTCLDPLHRSFHRVRIMQQENQFPCLLMSSELSSSNTLTRFALANDQYFILLPVIALNS